MPKGPRKLLISFGNETLTHYGGVYLLHRSHWHQECGCNRYSPYSAQQSLHRRRVVAGDPLPDHSWSRTNRDHTALATKWGLSVLERTADLPRSQHPQTFLVAYGTPGSAQVAQAPRPLLGPNDHQALFAFSLDFRSRFYSSCSLRKTTRRRSRLQ